LHTHGSARKKRKGTTKIVRQTAPGFRSKSGFPIQNCLLIGNEGSFKSLYLLAYETDANIIAGLKQLAPATMPVFQLVCNQGPLAGQTFYTTDPGKALLTGQCSDIGRGKGLILRGLAARAPYFHNGAAANLS